MEYRYRKVSTDPGARDSTGCRIFVQGHDRLLLLCSCSYFRGGGGGGGGGGVGLFGS